MRISDWSSDVCSSDLVQIADQHLARRFLDLGRDLAARLRGRHHDLFGDEVRDDRRRQPVPQAAAEFARVAARPPDDVAALSAAIHAAERPGDIRSEEHTSELQSLMRTSYAVFCLK